MTVSKIGRGNGEYPHEIPEFSMFNQIEMIFSHFFDAYDNSLMHRAKGSCLFRSQSGHRPAVSLGTLHTSRHKNSQTVRAHHDDHLMAAYPSQFGTMNTNLLA
jgi:hypothetical protein